MLLLQQGIQHSLELKLVLVLICHGWRGVGRVAMQRAVHVIPCALVSRGLPLPAQDAAKQEQSISTGSAYPEARQQLHKQQQRGAAAATSGGALAAEAADARRGSPTSEPKQALSVEASPPYYPIMREVRSLTRHCRMPMLP